jgi:hypothetical protein
MNQLSLVTCLSVPMLSASAQTIFAQDKHMKKIVEVNDLRIDGAVVLLTVMNGSNFLNK